MATNPNVPPPQPVEPLTTPPEPGEVQTTPMPMVMGMGMDCSDGNPRSHQRENLL